MVPALFLRRNFILPKPNIMKSKIHQYLYIHYTRIGKTITTLFSGAALLILTSCTKTSPPTDVDAALKKNYLFNTWIIDDDNSANHNSTQNSNTFQGKQDPHILIRSDYSYELSYNSRTMERGTCSADGTAKKLTFSPQGGVPYSFDLIALSEEVLTLKATYSKTTSSTTAEGVVTTSTQNFSETLYMEDND